MDESQNNNQIEHKALEKKIETISSEKIQLEKKNLSLQQKVKDLELENNVLIENIERVKSELDKFSEVQNKTYLLTKRISELEDENMELRDKGAKIDVEEDILAEMEFKIDGSEAEQSTTILSLRNKIKEQEEYISFIEKENLEFREKWNKQKSTQSFSAVEGNIIRLQKKIVTLENQNKALEEKNQVLKAALLLHVDTETTRITEIPKKSTTIPLPEVPKGRVQEMVNKRHAAIDTDETNNIIETDLKKEEPKGFVKPFLEKRTFDIEDKEQKEKIASKTSIGKEISQGVQDKTTPIYEAKEAMTETETETEKDIDVEDVGIIETSEGRRKCPICGNINKNLIHEMVDRSKLISGYAGLYGKKYRCGQCGAEWR